MLDGKKTYLAAGAAIATTAGAVLQGQIGWQQGLIGGLISLSQIFLRIAVSKQDQPTGLK